MSINNPVLTLTASGLATVTKVARLDSGAKGLLCLINIPAGNTGTSPTLTVTLNGITPDGMGTTANGSGTVPGTAYLLLASAALAAGSALVSTLLVFPSAPVTANVSANAACTQDIQVSAVVGGTTPAVTAYISLVSLM